MGWMARGQVGLEAESADLDDVAVVEQDFLNYPAVDTRSRSPAAVAQFPPLGHARQNAVDRGHLWRHQVEVADGAAAQDDEVAVQDAMFFCRVAVGHAQCGTSRIEGILVS